MRSVARFLFRDVLLRILFFGNIQLAHSCT